MNKPTNTNLERTLGVIYPCTTNNIQVEHELMNLAIGGSITRTKVYPYVMTKIVIEAFEKLAEFQGFKTLNF